MEQYPDNENNNENENENTVKDKINSGDSVSIITDSSFRTALSAGTSRENELIEEILKLRHENHDLNIKKLELQIIITELESKLNEFEHDTETLKNLKQQLFLNRQKLKGLELSNSYLKEELEDRNEQISILEDENNRIIDIVRLPDPKTYWINLGNCTIL